MLDMAKVNIGNTANVEYILKVRYLSIQKRNPMKFCMR